jgi:hypothetical protein
VRRLANTPQGAGVGTNGGMPECCADPPPLPGKQVLLSPFTNLDVTEVPERAAKLDASRRALTIMLRSWTGIILLASDERVGLAAVLHLLSDPSIEEAIRTAVFEVLEEVLKPMVSDHVSPPGTDGHGGGVGPARRAVSDLRLPPRGLSWWCVQVTSSLRQPSRIPAEYRSTAAPQADVVWEGEGGDSGWAGGGGLPEVHNLWDSYLAFLLAVLIKCGLLECLTVRGSREVG